MRFRHGSGEDVHLGYCTNVHPAEDLAGILDQLDTYAVPVREQLAADRLGVGLWLAQPVAAALAGDPGATLRLRTELGRRGLEVVTLNGFPYQGFHQPVVKHAVYRPDWSSRLRLEYTVDLARVLALLLPEDVTTGSISTLPFGWRAGWTADRHVQSLRNLVELGRGLKDVRHDSGRTIKVALEPEPGCVVETTGEAAHHLSHLDPDHFGICLDVCHLAVAFEDPHEALRKLDRAGVSIVKAQLSCALHAERPADPDVRRALAAFTEPRFLHQTRRAGAPPTGVDDLPQALAGPLAMNRDAPWRSHFHVPLHADPEPPLTSTRPVLRQALAALLAADRPGTTHLDVETYTWSVLPTPPRTAKELAAGIAAELDWTRRELLTLGLTEQASPSAVKRSSP
ncbi:metabolite traffic protein EboE [Streptomyces sp. NPDC002812]|uniref:metabolite traffic protein EboE n=1 Tax=Streptomyces sp. NPDC002812 TaxID=3154434 RepID=UPI0033239687